MKKSNTKNSINSQRLSQSFSRSKFLIKSEQTLVQKNKYVNK